MNEANFRVLVCTSFEVSLVLQSLLATLPCHLSVTNGARSCSGFTYTIYTCFLTFFCLKSENQRFHWKRLFKAWLHINTVPALQVFYIRSFND